MFYTQDMPLTKYEHYTGIIGEYITSINIGKLHSLKMHFRALRWGEGGGGGVDENR